MNGFFQDDKELAMIAIVVLGIVCTVAKIWGIDVESVFTHAVTAISALAVGKKLGE